MLLDVLEVSTVVLIMVLFPLVDLRIVELDRIVPFVMFDLMLVLFVIVLVLIVVL